MSREEYVGILATTRAEVAVPANWPSLSPTEQRNLVARHLRRLAERIEGPEVDVMLQPKYSRNSNVVAVKVSQSEAC